MEELNLKDILIMFWKKKWIFLGIILICTIVGAIYSYASVVPQYSAKVSLIVNTRNINQHKDDIDYEMNRQILFTYKELITSDKVIDKVKNNLNINSDIKGSVKADLIKDTEMITITANSTIPEEATKIANETAKVFQEKTIEIYDDENTKIIDVAKVPNAPYNIHHVKDIIIFSGIGFILACLCIIVLNMFNDNKNA